MALRFYLIFILCLVLGASDKLTREESVYRLPGNTRPLAYSLQLLPGYGEDTKMFTLTGQVEILIEVLRATTDIILNAVDMKFNDVAVLEVETQKKVKVNIYMLDENEQMKISLEDNLVVGRQYVVKISFGSLLRSDMTGFYISTYTENNKKKYVAFDWLP